ncbi:MAG: hypothetical protein NTV49_07510, partial [Kiritimatiellaeota bacterium]|nr:hypothetical protein [Kiritimatiellota bacterium]
MMMDRQSRVASRDQLRAWSRSPGARLIAGLLLAVSILFLCATGLVMVQGGTWTRVFCLPCPRRYLAGSLGAWFGWYFILRGVHNTAQEWGLFFKRAVLVVLSVGMTLLTMEISLRVMLARQERMNSIENLMAVCKARKPSRVIGSHQLLSIIAPSDDPFLMFELQKNMDKEFGGYRVRTNAEGLRSNREYPKAKGAHTVRIVGVGDSGLWGWDVEQGQDTLTVLESNL